MENHKKSSLKMYLYHTSNKIKADKLENYFFLIEAECLIREKVVTFRMVKLNLLLSIFLITK